MLWLYFNPTSSTEYLLKIFICGDPQNLYSAQTFVKHIWENEFMSLDTKYPWKIDVCIFLSNKWVFNGSVASHSSPIVVLLYRCWLLWWQEWRDLCLDISHDDVIIRKHFPRYWPFVWGIHRSPVNAPHKGQWCEALMFSLVCARINGWVNNRKAGDLRRHCAHYDVTIMLCIVRDEW